MASICYLIRRQLIHINFSLEVFTFRLLVILHPIENCSHVYRRYQLWGDGGVTKSVYARYPVLKVIAVRGLYRAIAYHDTRPSALMACTVSDRPASFPFTELMPGTC